MIVVFKTILAYVTLMIIGTNIIGLLVRGFYIPKRMETDNEFINEMQDKAESSNAILNFISVILLIVYLYALNHYWNIYLFLSGLILILSRIPDLLFEIGTGKKINMRDMPKKPLNYFCSFLDWAVIPLIWYSFYVLNN